MRVRSLLTSSFIGHNFGDYKNFGPLQYQQQVVLSVTILETTKTNKIIKPYIDKFYRSQFWRLQKRSTSRAGTKSSFIGHNFGDYKNWQRQRVTQLYVLSVTILETTKTFADIYSHLVGFYRSQFWRLQKPQMVSANDTMMVRSYSAFQAE